MGKRISQHALDEMRRRERPPETQVFLSVQAIDTYGFCVNIGHSCVAPYYALFKRFLQRPVYPLDDWERHLFEADMIYYVFRELAEKRFGKSVVTQSAERLLRHRDMAEQWKQYREQAQTAANL